MKRKISWVMLAYAVTSTPWALWVATPEQLQQVIAFDSKLALVYGAIASLWQAKQMEEPDA